MGAHDEVEWRDIASRRLGLLATLRNIGCSGWVEIREAYGRGPEIGTKWEALMRRDLKALVDVGLITKHDAGWDINMLFMHTCAMTLLATEMRPGPEDELFAMLGLLHGRDEFVTTERVESVMASGLPSGEPCDLFDIEYEDDTFLIYNDLGLA